MATRTIWGNVNQNRMIDQGSGDFRVVEGTPTGDYTVMFDENSFSDVPAVVVTVREPAGSAGHIATAEMLQLDSTQFKIVIRSTATQDAYDKPFSFFAIGTSD